MSSKIVHTIKEVILETLWPERCACCDVGNTLLCHDCSLELNYIDTYKACPICGSPFGKVQCCDCSSTLLEPLGIERPPFEQCVSVALLDERTGRIIALYKDAGDRGLAQVIAHKMRQVTPPVWIRPDTCVTYIPAGKQALRRRGWDHGQKLAEVYAQNVHLPLKEVFQRPEAKDQRSLTRSQRFKNMSASLRVKTNNIPQQVILVDDVFTTGSTLFAATNAIKEVQPETEVRCITFARTQ